MSHPFIFKGGSDMNNNETKFLFVVVGVGGTGGYFASFLARQLAALSYGLTPLLLVDGDVIEEKNIIRQPFVEAEIGENKALNITSKINSVFNTLDVSAYPRYLDEPNELISLIEKRLTLGMVPVICGCVDNHAARVLMHDVFYRLDDCIYLDSGNERDGGEVVVGFKYKGEVVSPPKGHYYPEIYDNPGIRKSEEGCQSKIDTGEQLLVTNILAATTMLMYVSRLLSDGILNMDLTFFNSFEHKLISKSHKAFSGILYG